MITALATTASPLAVLAYRERRQIGWIQDARTGGLASARLRHLGPAPMLRDPRFRLARRWHVSDLWLQLYVRHPAVRDPDGHGRA